MQTPFSWRYRGLPDGRRSSGTQTRRLLSACLLILGTFACDTAVPNPAPSTPATQPAPVTDAFATVPDSAWITVTGPTLIGFYPVVSNDEIEKDEGLAMALDDFSFHLGTAQDSLRAAVATLNWWRTPTNSSAQAP